MSARVIVVGDIVTDVVAILAGPVAPASDTPARIRVTGGGAGANTATWLAHAGARVTLCGVVGADGAGDARLAELRAAGVDCAIRAVGDAGTGSIVVLSDGRERTMLTDRGANLLLTPADVDAAFRTAPDARHLHVSGYPLLDEASRPAARHALATAARRGLSTSVDAASAGPLRRVGPANFQSWVRGVDVLFANADESRALLDSGDLPAADAAARLASWAGVAVVKRGAAGAVAASLGTDPVAVPVAPASVVDTTGAGDAFAAGFLVGWLAGLDVAGALAAGAILGARAVSAVGARPIGATGRRR